MPKIVRILNRFNVGGPTYNVAYLTKYLPKTYTTTLVGGQKNDSEASSEYILKELDIPYTIIPEMKRSLSIINEIKAFRALVKILQSEKPDIVHTHAAKAGTLGRLAAWYCGVPLVFHTFHGHVFHSYFNPVITKIFILIERFLARKTTAIIAISQQQKKELSEDFKICHAHKITIIPLGFDLEKFYTNQCEKREEFRTAYSIADHEIAIGIVGRLVPIKNHTLFIDSFLHCLRTNKKQIKAYIIGDGELKQELEQHWHSQALPEEAGRLVFTSWIEQVDIAYSGLDIVCLSSLNEGTPVSLIEAQAAGKPIVSTRVGGIENIVQENSTALLTDSSLEHYSKALLQLIENDRLREQLSANSKLFSKSAFSYTRLCRDMEMLYETHIAHSLK